MNNSTFFISDHHFGHRNIIEYEGRKFKKTLDMDTEMINKWNSVVNKENTVYHLGDFAFYDKETITSIVMQLNGKINLVMGNHENHSIQWYYDCGFNKVYDKPIVLGGFIILSHEPIYTNDNSPFVNIHGHLHSKESMCDKNINVSVEKWEYTPVTYKKLKKYNLKGE